MGYVEEMNDSRVGIYSIYSETRDKLAFEGGISVGKQVHFVGEKKGRIKLFFWGTSRHR